MKQILPVLLAASLLLSGCSTSSSTAPETSAETTIVQTIAEQTTLAETTVEVTTVEETTVEETTVPETTVPETTVEETVEVSELFESIYYPYAKREKSFVFSHIKEFLKSTGYKLDIVEPTAEVVGKITVTDENGDSVFFAFNQVNGIEMITTVSYHRQLSNSEVSLSNYSSDGSPANDQYSTHVIGSSSNKVSGPDAQRKFLFK